MPAPCLLLLLVFLAVPGRAPAAVSPEWAAEWRADLAFAADTLPRVHPNLFHTVSRERFRTGIDSLGGRLGSLDHHEIVVELARIMALVGDGHTRLTMPFDSAAGFFTGHATTAAPLVPGLVFPRLPLALGVFEDGVFVTGAAAGHRALLGGRVVELGTLPIAAAIAAVEPTIHRDNGQQVRDLLPAWLVTPAILHARGVTRDRERVRIVVEDAHGARREATVAAAEAGRVVARTSARAAGEPPLVDRHPDRRHWVERVAGSRVAYARFREVVDDEAGSVEAFAAEVGRVLAAGATALILDLRGNVGGDAFLNRPLVREIIAAPALREPAALFVLEDRGTFSAATMLLADLERHTGMVLAGETSGGAPNGYGDSRRVRLPRTGLTVRVSTLYWQTTDARDRRTGFAPLVAVAPRFADWQANRDAAVDSVLALAAGGGVPAGSWRGTAALGATRFEVALRAGAGAAPGVRVDCPALGLEDREGAEVSIAGDRVEFTAVSAGGTLRFRARAAGGTLVGNIGYKGSRIPFVAGRAR